MDTELGEIKSGSQERPWELVYFWGGITGVIVILLTISDIIIGTALGGSLTTIPETAVERFAQFQNSTFLGLYNLDMLNLVTTVLLLPTYFALCASHRQTNLAAALLATVIYYVGATIFIANNSALPMMDLSSRYWSAPHTHQALLAAAGETMLAKGAHGSLGAFPGFFLLTIGSMAMSFAMLKGQVFSRTTAWTGIAGTTLLLVYIVLVTFVAEIQDMAMLVAAPGGLLSLVWMILFTTKLFKLGHCPKCD